MTKQEILDIIDKNPNALFTRVGSKPTTRFRIERLDSEKNSKNFYRNTINSKNEPLLLVRYVTSNTILTKENNDDRYNQAVYDHTDSNWNREGMCFEWYNLAPESVAISEDPDYGIKKLYTEYILSEDADLSVSFEEFKGNLEENIEAMKQALITIRDDFETEFDTILTQLKNTDSNEQRTALYKETRRFGCHSQQTLDLVNKIIAYTTGKEINLADYSGSKRITFNTLPDEPVVYWSGKLVAKNLSITIKEGMPELPRLATDEELETLATSNYNNYLYLLREDVGSSSTTS